MPLHPNQIPIGVAAASRSGQAGTIYNPGGYSSSNNPTASTGKRTAHDFSHNKAITKRLATAVHYQQVLDIIAESVHHFDEVNVATALHRLAKLQPPNLSSHPPAIIYTNQFQQLIYAIKTLLDRFEAQAVSNTLWAFATLGYYPDGDTLDAIGEHAVTILSTFRPQATSNTLWAYAKLGYPPPPSLLAAAAHKMVLDFPKSVPQVGTLLAKEGRWQVPAGDVFLHWQALKASAQPIPDHRGLVNRACFAGHGYRAFIGHALCACFVDVVFCVCFVWFVHCACIGYGHGLTSFDSGICTCGGRGRGRGGRVIHQFCMLRQSQACCHWCHRCHRCHGITKAARQSQHTVTTILTGVSGMTLRLSPGWCAGHFQHPVGICHAAALPGR